METSKEQVIEDLSALLEIGTGLSYFKDDHFFVCRYTMSREKVVTILSQYFKNRQIADGWSLVVEPYEAIFTELSLTKAK